jgi:hypothetical protein
VLLTFVGSVHNPVIMLGMLVKVLCRDSVAARRRLPREGNVPFEDLMRGASDFNVRTVTIEALTTRRHLLPIAVRIVTEITTIRSAGLSWSHDTYCIAGEVGVAIPGERIGTRSLVGRVTPLFCTAPALSHRHVRWGDHSFQQFFGTMLAEAGLLDAASG